MIELGKFKNPASWSQARNQLESEVISVIGPLPEPSVELQVKVTDEITIGNCVRQRVNYFVGDWDRVAAWLFLPEGKDDLPGLICCHSKTPSGKDETAGIEGDPLLGFARRYAELGYATLAPDCITAGERVSAGLEPFNAKHFYRDFPKMSVLGKMLWDDMRAVDVLSETRRVDAGRLGVVGHGLGAENALVLAAFDERIQSCVASCGFTRFNDNHRIEEWALGPGFARLPRLKAEIKSKTFPFDWEHILALIAPTPTLVVSANDDADLSNARSCEKAVERACSIYKLLGAPDALSLYIREGDARMTQDALEAADEWFERWL